MNEKIAYISYGDMAVMYNAQSNSFCINYGRKAIVCDAEIVVVKPENSGEVCANSFKSCIVSHSFNIENSILTVRYGDSSELEAEPVLEFKMDNEGLLLTVSGLRENSSYIKGMAFWGEDIENDTFAMSMGRSGFDLRCALGPAASNVDNALYNRVSDKAFIIDGGKKVRFRYNWEKSCYDFVLTTGLVEFQQRFKFHVKDDVIAQRYKIDFSPINKNSTFKKPPAGWMTWYAVKFDASEETVLENVKFQQEHLKRYGADAIWVDWEWYHKDFKGERDDGTDTFNPDKEKYPHGLKFVSDKIKEAGFIPALWIGFTNDSSDNEYTRENPEIILKKKVTWCGNHFYDFSHPKYLNEFLPKALKQVFDWGYEAVKFDTLPAAIDYHEEYHMNMYDPTLTTKEAFRGAMKKTREILGKDMYMLSCAAVKDQDLLWVADIFDAGRVGNDIFEWKDFIKEGVRRTMRFYPMHNIVLYPDPDNVVIREEFNTYNQAASRIYFVSLLGLPMTFGDDFKVLSQERVELIQKCLPVMDIHPMDTNEAIADPRGLIINLSVELPFESYNVVNLFNIKDSEGKRKIYLDKDLHLDEGEYHIFDFTKEKYIGAVSDFFEIESAACESRIFSIRKKTGNPQMLSTSRHVSQGAAEIKRLCQTEKAIKLSAELVGGDDYRVYLYVPDGFEIESCGGFKIEKTEDTVYCMTFTAEQSKVYDFEIKFNKL